MEHVTNETFDTRVLTNEKRITVLFYASWCPHCINFKPTFETSKLNSSDKIEVLIDEDENPLWDRFSIKDVPTIIVFENGKIIARRDSKLGSGLTKIDMDFLIKELG